MPVTAPPDPISDAKSPPITKWPPLIVTRWLTRLRQQGCSRHGDPQAGAWRRHQTSVSVAPTRVTVGDAEGLRGPAGMSECPRWRCRPGGVSTSTQASFGDVEHEAPRRAQRLRGQHLGYGTRTRRRSHWREPPRDGRPPPPRSATGGREGVVRERSARVRGADPRAPQTRHPPPPARA